MTSPATRTAAGLEPGQRADAGIRSILLALLDTMAFHEAGVLDGSDPERLHDFRVAVRRTRTALAQLGTALPAGRVRRYRREFAWLGAITTPRRDLDVYLLQFGAFRMLLPEALRPHLQPLREHLEARRETEHRILCRKLRSTRYREMTRAWRTYLASSLPRRPAAPDARCPVERLANRRIWRMYRRVLRDGKAIRGKSPPTELHELRKSCKKLRYLMEFFQPLYPPKRVRGLLKELRKLQDNLGEFQDLSVQIGRLEDMGATVSEGRPDGPRIRQATSHLTARLRERMGRARADFRARFRRFRRRRNRRAFRTLFRHPD